MEAVFFLILEIRQCLCEKSEGFLNMGRKGFFKPMVRLWFKRITQEHFSPFLILQQEEILNSLL